MAKAKQHEEVVQQDVEITEEIAAKVEEAVAPKDAYKIPEAKTVVEYPGHTRRDFRN